MGFAVGVNERDGLDWSVEPSLLPLRAPLPLSHTQSPFQNQDGSKARKGQTLEANCDLLFTS